MNLYFSDCLSFFDEFKWLFQFPVVEILTRNSLESIPNDWVDIFKTMKCVELNKFVLGELWNENWPETMKNFVKGCERLNQLPKTVNLSLPELPQLFTVGLSDKKQQEILHLAELTHRKCSQRQIRTIVDLGSGLGYVCQILNHLYNYQVIGLESNSENVRRAKERQFKIYPNSKESVKYVCIKVSDSSVTEIENLLNESNEKICLIGLHSCGDLSFDACKLFSAINNIQLLIMMSCCYHKLGMSDKDSFNNFPASKLLRENFESHSESEKTLNRPFLRLASQEPNVRWENMSPESHETHSHCVLFRAVLELYVQQNQICLKKNVRKGTRVSQSKDFESYMQSMMDRYTFDGERCDKDSAEKIKLLWNENKWKLDLVEVYTGLQMLMQAPAESLVIQDRLCWLLEHDYQAEVISVLSNKISPRCYALFASKNS